MTALITVLIVLKMLLHSLNAFSATPGNVAEAAGGYLGAAYLMAEAANTECRYAIRVDAARVKRSAEKEIESVLTKDEIHDFLKFRRKVEFESKEIVSGMLKKIKANNFDDKTACGILSGFIHQNFGTYQELWRRSIK